MREPARIAGMFGVIGLSTLFLLVLFSLASAQVRVYEQPASGPTEVIILSPSASQSDAAAVAEASMRTAVANRLQATPSLGGSRLNVSSEGGTVILEGTVIETSDVAEAEAVALNTSGVRGVVNRIRVDPMYVGVNPVVPAPDSVLAMHVAEALARHFDDARVDRDDAGYEVEIDRDGSNDDWEIDVRSYGGQVTLGGSLPSYDAIGRALSIARAVPGVQSVQSNLMLAQGDYDDDNDFDGSTHVGPFQKPHFKPFYKGRDADDGYDGYPSQRYDDDDDEDRYD